VAGWIRYVSGTDDRGNAIDVRDPLSDKIRAIVEPAATRPRQRPAGAERSLWSRSRAKRVFVEAVSQAYQRITRHGARQAVIETLNI
jgi:mannitol-1-phosphate/altronate dehydrogenase